MARNIQPTTYKRYFRKGKHKFYMCRETSIMSLVPSLSVMRPSCTASCKAETNLKRIKQNINYNKIAEILLSTAQ